MSTKDVISILDHQTVKMSKVTKRFIDEERKKKRVIDEAAEEVKSFVITKDAIYCSPISSLTLKRRAQFVNSLDQFPSVETESEELTE
nr:extracellular matrix/biofilm biosynthesis regulator RemA family protein [Brevibacillus fluminis]